MPIPPKAPAPALRIPERSPVLAQVTAILRENIERATWQKFLPSERTLADQLQVSRPTVRAALAALHRERWVQVSHGLRTRVVAGVAARRGLASKLICVLSVTPPHAMPPSDVFVMGELRRHLNDAGYQLVAHADQRLKWEHPQSFLETLVRQEKIGCWLLLTQSAAVQRWFAEGKLRTIVLGSCHNGVQLPSFDVDFRAVCRHAAGVCLSLGHRRIALVIPRTGLAGDLASETGFREAFDPRQHPDATPLVIQHDGTVENIRRALNPSLRSKNRPTAILVSHPRDFLTVLTHLTDAGIRVPRDVALVSRGTEEFLAHLVPSVARYVVDWTEFARRVARVVVQATRTGTLAPRPVRVMPQFKKGDTLAPGAAT